MIPQECTNINEINALRTAERKGDKIRKVDIVKNLFDVLDDATISLKTGLDESFIKSLRL